MMDEKENSMLPETAIWSQKLKLSSDIQGTETRIRILIETSERLKEDLRVPLMMSGDGIVAGISKKVLAEQYERLEKTIQVTIMMEACRLKEILGNRWQEP